MNSKEISTFDDGSWGHFRDPLAALRGSAQKKDDEKNRKAIAVAVLAEREACAVIAEKASEFPVSGTADGIAMAIRARSQTESIVHKEEI